MTTNAARDEELIESGDLSPQNVPSADADVSAMEAFCLTVDGYQGGKLSSDDLLRQAEQLERSGLEDASLDQLRAAAFIRQRALSWAYDGDPAALPPLIAKMRRVVGEIRRRVVQEQENASERS
jgi:hypothetical protein